jgi:hypothetical protein
MPRASSILDHWRVLLRLAASLLAAFGVIVSALGFFFLGPNGLVGLLAVPIGLLGALLAAFKPRTAAAMMIAAAGLFLAASAYTFLLMNSAEPIPPRLQGYWTTERRLAALVGHVKWPVLVYLSAATLGITSSLAPRRGTQDPSSGSTGPLQPQAARGESPAGSV